MATLAANQPNVPFGLPSQWRRHHDAPSTFLSQPQLQTEPAPHPFQGQPHTSLGACPSPLQGPAPCTLWGQPHPPSGASPCFNPSLPHRPMIPRQPSSQARPLQPPCRVLRLTEGRHLAETTNQAPPKALRPGSVPTYSCVKHHIRVVTRSVFRLESDRLPVAEGRDEERLDRVHAVLGLVEDLGVL